MGKSGPFGLEPAHSSLARPGVHPEPSDPHAAIGGLIEAFEEVLDFRAIPSPPLGRIGECENAASLILCPRNADISCLNFRAAPPQVPPFDTASSSPYVPVHLEGCEP
jgi:hypothetical protein